MTSRGARANEFDTRVRDTEPLMRAPKILAVASAVDLDFRYGCTPAWWQLWKGMYEAGVDLIVTPYRGRPVESPWWRTEPNPTYREGETYARVRDLAALERILERERDVAAVVVFTVPMSHLRGIPAHLRERFGVPVVFYDGDVPMSLPEFGGMDTGFNYYHGADPAEYDLVLSNSEGGLTRLEELGARRAEAIFWAADPELFRPLAVEKETDVFFYGYGDKFRRDWMRALVGEPSRRLPDTDFALGGRDFRGDTGRARLVGDVPFNAFNRAIAAARINLNLTRRAHAGLYASSTARPFELAMAGAAIVSNPYEGVERWFEPGHELLVARDEDEATSLYGELLADPAATEELGRRARERALDEHTYAHRARRVLDLLGLTSQAAEPVEAARG
jgi:hypothetical protein